MSKTTILNKHLEFKKTSVHSIEKLKDIERYLKKFLDSTTKPLSKFNEDDIAKFLNSLKFSIRTINDIKTYIKVFLKWNFADWSSRFRNLDRLCKMQKPSKAYQPEDMINYEEFEKIVKAERDLMYKVYWLVMFYGGFRPSEACNLKWDQVFFEDEGVIIKLHTTKTNKDFYKALPKEAEQLLKELKKQSNSFWIFPSPIKENCPIVARSICGRLKRLSKKVLGKKVVPYALRHSIATILYGDDKRKDSDIAQQLGHNKSMKEIYMNLDENTLKSKARSLWIKTKPLSKDEKEELNILRKQVEKNKLDNEKIIKLLKRFKIMEQLPKIKIISEKEKKNLGENYYKKKMVNLYKN